MAEHFDTTIPAELPNEQSASIPANNISGLFSRGRNIPRMSSEGLSNSVSIIAEHHRFVLESVQSCDYPPISYATTGNQLNTLNAYDEK
jgi:hypothetical protein